MMSTTPPAETTAAPRYLRFMTALVLGTALTTVPVLAGCGDNVPGPPQVDAGLVDAKIVDAEPDAEVVDGPLAPPDLPRLA